MIFFSSPTNTCKNSPSQKQKRKKKQHTLIPDDFSISLWFGQWLSVQCKCRYTNIFKMLVAMISPALNKTWNPLVFHRLQAMPEFIIHHSILVCTLQPNPIHRRTFSDFRLFDWLVLTSLKIYKREIYLFDTGRSLQTAVDSNPMIILMIRN